MQGPVDHECRCQEGRPFFFFFRPFFVLKNLRTMLLCFLFQPGRSSRKFSVLHQQCFGSPLHGFSHRRFQNIWKSIFGGVPCPLTPFLISHLNSSTKLIFKCLNAWVHSCTAIVPKYSCIVFPEACLKNISWLTNNLTVCVCVCVRVGGVVCLSVCLCLCLCFCV